MMKLKLKKETRVEFMLYVMFFLMMILALLLAKAINDLGDSQEMIKRHQKIQNETTIETTSDMQKRILALEEVVVLQSNIILELDKQQPFPESSQVVQEPKKAKVEQEDPGVKPFWPVMVAGTLEIFRTIVKPTHILSP